MIAAFISFLVPVLAGGPSGNVVARNGTELAVVAVTYPAGQVVAVTKTDGDAAVMKRAKALLAGLQTGTIDRSELSAALGADYNATVLANAAKTLPKGNPKEFVLLDKTDTNGTTTYVYRVGWDAGDVDYVFGFDDATFEVTKLFTRPGPPQ